MREIIAIYGEWGHDRYTEEVSQTAHAVQCAGLAESAGAPSALVLACLLHDIGHLVDLRTSGGYHETRTDLEHEATGARALSALFPPSVTGPIALHVAAKRYLCATDPGYAGSLSATSTATLTLQGGPMDVDEARRFSRLTHASSAVSLRHWDDAGKDSTGEAVPLAAFVDLLGRHSERISQ